MGKKQKHWQILFSWAPEPLWTVTASTKLKDACSLEEKLWQIYVLKSRDIILLTEVHTVKAMVFPVVMYKCENCTIKKSECWTDAFKLVLEKTLESPLVDKEIKPVNPKGNQPRIFIGRTEAEFETDILATWWEELTHWKRHWCWERLRAGGEGGDRGWDGWMASLTQWTFEQTLGDSKGQGSLVCFSPWVRRFGHDLETE